MRGRGDEVIRHQSGQMQRTWEVHRIIDLVKCNARQRCIALSIQEVPASPVPASQVTVGVYSRKASDRLAAVSLSTCRFIVWMG